MAALRPPSTAPPAPPPSLTLRLAMAGRHAGHELRHRLAPLDLDPRQYRVLATVAELDGCPQRAVAERLRIPPSRVVGLVDELSARGLLERVPHPTDRRAHALRTTPAGRRLLEAARPLAAATEEALVAGLSAEERHLLASLLERIDPSAGAPDGCC